VKSLNKEDYIGRVVYSKAGRDSGRFFLIINVIDYNYVNIADGELRKIENLKKKKLKHLLILEECSHEIMGKLLNEEYVNNATVRKFLENRDVNKEV
jgi:ribosomal protein L14E/L6E/L27E